MGSRKAAPPRPQQWLGAQGNVSIADRTSSIANPFSRSPQAVPFRAELIGSDCCAAAGVTARGSAPVLALCRILIGAGHDLLIAPGDGRSTEAPSNSRPAWPPSLN